MIGLYGQKLHEEVEQLIDDVGLSEKRHVPSSSLSGGMKVRENDGLHT